MNLYKTEKEQPVSLDIGMNHFIIPKYLSGCPIIDVGANIGGFIDKIRANGINSHIIAIEASNTNIDILLKKHCDNVTLMHKALVGLNHPKIVTFTEVRGLLEWGSATDINENRKRTHGKCIKYEVEAITLEDLIKEDIDYLKMDIEGSETDVIKTLSPELAKHIRQISFEIHNHDEIELKDLLSKLNYDVFLMDGEIFGIRKDVYI
jgi:FkbM family methyltransferase